MQTPDLKQPHNLKSSASVVKLKNVSVNILIALISATICLLIADRLIRSLNLMHSRRLYSSRADNSDNKNIERAVFLKNKFQTDVQYRAIDIKTPLILFIGDSITLGVPLNKAEHAYPDQFDADILMASGPGPRVLARNVSGPGVNIRDEAAAFETFAARRDLNIKLIALGYCLNDIFETGGQARGISGMFRQLMEQKKLGPEFTKDPHLFFYKQKDNIAMVEQSFSRMRAAAAKRKIPALAAVFPYFTDFNSKPYRYAQIHEQVKSVASNAGVDKFDLFQIFGGYPSGLFKTENDIVHPNPLGHKFAADALYKYISASYPGMLPPMAGAAGIYAERNPSAARNMCDSLYGGENRNPGYSGCVEALSSLVKKGKILRRKSSPDSFFIDFDL